MPKVKGERTPVNNPMTPNGVEHAKALAHRQIVEDVNNPMTPNGVEHYCYAYSGVMQIG